MSDADQTNGISTKCQCGFKGGETPDCKGKGEEGKPPEMPQMPKPEDKPSQPQNQQPCAATGAEASFLGASTTATTTATSTKPCLRSDGSSGALSTAFGDSLGSTFGSVSSAVRSAGSSAFDFISGLAGQSTSDTQSTGSESTPKPEVPKIKVEKVESASLRDTSGGEKVGSVYTSSDLSVKKSDNTFGEPASRVQNDGNFSASALRALSSMRETLLSILKTLF